MSHVLAVVVDGFVQLEFDPAREMPPEQAEYVDQMDARMNDGFDLDGQFIESPDQEQRVRFVSQTLAHALGMGNEVLAAAMCTYLGVRDRELKQVRISPGETNIKIDLDYDNVYEKPEPQPQVVQFDMGNKPE